MGIDWICILRLKASCELPESELVLVLRMLPAPGDRLYDGNLPSQNGK